MNNKIGIITLYNNSINYGGTLQAYALEKFLNHNGFEAKQISYNKKKFGKANGFKLHYKELGLIKTIPWFYDRAKKSLSSKIASKTVNKDLKKDYYTRLEKFKDFRNEINHTEIEYDKDTISNVNDIFDAFICGSDQIWKPGVVCPDFLLGFASDNKIKVSYAASISKTNISEEDMKFMVPFLNRFDKISIREESDVNKISKFVSKDVSWVVDPTLLLDAKEWESVCSNKMYTKEKYLFCYLLEANTKKYRIIKKFAKKNKLKIVTIPFSNGNLNLKDNKFGDIKATDAGPKDFLTLIKNAEIVITDSFHAAVFSNIFKTKYFVLERTEATTMNSRIISLLKMFNMMERFINDKELLTKDLTCNFKEENEFYNIREFSKKYLLSIKNLKGDKIEY